MKEKRFVTQCSVLTAGHCLPVDHNIKFVRVYLGRHIRTSGGTKYGVKEATFHPGWKDLKAGTSEEAHPVAFDLLLLRLDREVIFSNIISPVCLPNGLEDRDEKLYNNTINCCPFSNKLFQQKCFFFNFQGVTTS